MKKISLALCLIACMCIIFCSCTIKKEQTLNIQGNMELNVEQGENWLNKMKIFLFIYKDNSPQLAAWIEDENGKYITTISVSEKANKRNWLGNPKGGRPEALPVWSYRQKSADVPETVTSATRKKSFEAAINKNLLTDGNTYNVFLEVNHSFDYNDYWTMDNSGVNGQPSLIYHTKFIAGQQGKFPLIPIGHGSVDGNDGNIVRKLETLSTALNIIHNVSVVVK